MLYDRDDLRSQKLPRGGNEDVCVLCRWRRIYYFRVPFFSLLSSKRFFSLTRTTNKQKEEEESEVRRRERDGFFFFTKSAAAAAAAARDAVPTLSREDATAISG